MAKRAYFFVIDAIMALLIMTVGVLLIFSFHKFAPIKQQASLSSSDVMQIMNTKIRSLNNEYCGINSYLTRNGNITDLENTMLEQVAEFYYRNMTKSCTFCKQLAWNVASNLTTNIPTEYNLMLKVNGTILYYRNHTPIEKAKIIVPSRKIVQSLYGGSEIAGPYIAEVYVWQ